jgi:hypothetical protein
VLERTHNVFSAGIGKFPSMGAYTLFLFVSGPVQETSRSPTREAGRIVIFRARWAMRSPVAGLPASRCALPCDVLHLQPQFGTLSSVCGRAFLAQW